MKAIVNIVFICLFSFFSHAQVKISSYYFLENTDELTNASLSDVNRFISLMSTNYIQIIEINSFCESGLSPTSKVISQTRTNSIIEKLGVNKKDVPCNNHGLYRQKIPFEVDNWNRVDVYYYQGEVREIEIGEVSKEAITNLQIVKSQKTKELDLLSISTKHSSPVIIPIKFIGGTDKFNSKSYIHLNALVDTLENNPSLIIEIRGHVCCGNNMRISKQRAKAVYKYLKSKEINTDRLSHQGFSNSLPLVSPERNNYDRALNRRVDIIFKNPTEELIVGN